MDFLTEIEAQRIMDEEWPKNRVPLVRPSWDETNMRIALEWAKRSPDAESKVGAWLTNDNQEPISGGYNGFPRRVDDYLLPNIRSEKYGKHDWMLHAEKNAIANAARLGQSTLNSIMYLTRMPCGPCLEFMWQCGIKEVVYIPFVSPMIDNKEYRVWLEQFKIITKNKIKLRPFSLPEEGV